MSVTHSARESIDQALNELLVVRDEARLRTHLLSLSARARLSQFESSFHTLLESRLPDGSLGEVALSTARELTSAITQLLTQHSTPKTLATPVGEFMSRGVRTCANTDSLAEVASILSDAACGLVPVLDQDQRLVGVLTARDVCTAAYTFGTPLAEIPVSAALSTTYTTVQSEASAEDAIELMRYCAVNRLLVLARDATVVGVVSLADLITLQPPSGSRRLEAAMENSQSRAASV